MQTSAAGSKSAWRPARGFTLLELLVVVALIALATAGVGLSLRDAAQSALERDADRLASLLESARAQARASGVAVQWRPTATGFVFEGLPRSTLPTQWLANTTSATVTTPVVLGPEPLIGPQAVALSQWRSSNNSDVTEPRTLWVVTDGLRPFQVQRSAAAP
jgi:general secretion pathway protein H